MRADGRLGNSQKSTVQSQGAQLISTQLTVLRFHGLNPSIGMASEEAGVLVKKSQTALSPGEKDALRPLG